MYIYIYMCIYIYTHRFDDDHDERKIQVPAIGTCIYGLKKYRPTATHISHS